MTTFTSTLPDQLLEQLGTPNPSETQHFNNNDDKTEKDPKKDPNLGPGSTPTDPQPSEDDDPHTF